jgi:hypothetical protein
VTLQHAQQAFERAMHFLPNDITTVHDYGFRDGQGTLWLAGRFDNVVGYDITMEHARGVGGKGLNLQIGDVRDPQGSADLIYVGHVIEQGHDSSFTNREKVVENLRNYCRYLLLQVHREPGEVFGWQDKLAPDAILHCTYTCHHNRTDSVTLLLGHL